MSAVATYFSMGGYAVFVWPAYGLTFVVLGGLALVSWWRHRDSLRTLDRLQRRRGVGR